MRRHEARVADSGDAHARATPVHGAILLAAGASVRLGHAKQLIEVDGEPRLRRIARALLATGPHELVIVLGHDAPRMRRVLVDLPLRCVVAHDHADGMSASLRTGIASLDPACAGALVALTDQPALDVAHLVSLCSAWHAAPDRAVASAYADVLGVPALLPRAWFARIAEQRGDVGARTLLRSRAHEVIAIGSPALARDVDTPGDLG